VTGDDGPSHHGLVDLVLALSIPGVAVFCPSVAADVAPMLQAALSLEGPAVIRWPKTPSATGTLAPAGPLEARRLVAGDPNLVLIGIGKLAHAARAAAALLEAEGISASVFDPRVIRPADEQMLQAAVAAELVVTAEDGLAAGGAGAYLQGRIAALAREQGLPVPQALVLGLDTAYFPHAKPDRILARAGLDAPGIAASVSAALGHLRATRGGERALDEAMGIET